MQGSGRNTVLLVALLVVAVGAGLAATILATAPSHAPNAGPSTELILPFWVVVLPILGLFVAGMALMIGQRARGTAASVPNPIVVAILVGMLLLAGFVVVSHFLGGGGILSGGGTSTQANSTVNSTPPANGTPLPNGPGGALDRWSIPPWVGDLLLFVLVGGFLAVLSGGLLASRLASPGRLSLRRRRSGGATAAAASALAEAQVALDEGADPRATILVLYGQLLSRLTAMIGDVDVVTPEEIRSQHLVRLGVGPRDANELTRLFEEARYSTHPMGAEAADRAQRAIGGALADLQRRAPAA